VSDVSPAELNRSKKGFSIKAFLPRSLFGRSLLILIIPIVLIQVITAYVFFDRHWNKMTMRLAYAVAGEVAVVAHAIEDGNDTSKLQNIISYADEHLGLLISFNKGAKLGAESKTTTIHVWESMVAHTLVRELNTALRKPFTLDIDFQEKWVRLAVQLDNGVLNVTLPGRRLFSSSGYIVLLWMIGSSIVLLMVAILFMRNQIRPIHKLAVAAEWFGKGRDVPAFKPTGAREVRQAAQAFMDMHKRIKRQIEQRTAMLAGVSHDLRTPLTRLKLQLAMLGDSPDVNAMKNDIAEMEKMIGGYLDFVRGEGDEQPEYVSLEVLLEKIVMAAKRQGIDASVSIAQDVNLTVRPMAFERAISNLISNAAKHAKKIWISAAIENEKLELSIEDDGPGIPEDQYEEVFKPFYRVDSSRNAETGGVGLGLPIAMDIINGHGGKIWLEKSSHGGLNVRIRLPL
jgi:two-component system, OmpR family, osmolarity sensor histidine kinase EnvZ